MLKKTFLIAGIMMFFITAGIGTGYTIALNQKSSANSQGKGSGSLVDRNVLQNKENATQIGPETGSGKDNLIISEPEKDEVQKSVYLTFDDGPDRIITPQVLQILDKYQVKATFFVIGTSVEKNPELLKDIANKGHAVGNHTYSHKYKEIYESKEAFLQELRKNDEVIHSLIGQRPAFFRDPGGRLKYDLEQQQYLADNGYTAVGWNIESYDSRSPRVSPEKMYNEVVRQVEARPDLWGKLIIVMHDSRNQGNTVAALPQIIEYLQNHGFEFRVFE